MFIYFYILILSYVRTSHFMFPIQFFFVLYSFDYKLVAGFLNPDNENIASKTPNFLFKFVLIVY